MQEAEGIKESDIERMIKCSVLGGHDLFRDLIVKEDNSFVFLNIYSAANFIRELNFYLISISRNKEQVNGVMPSLS